MENFPNALQLPLTTSALLNIPGLMSDDIPQIVPFASPQIKPSRGAERVCPVPEPPDFDGVSSPKASTVDVTSKDAPWQLFLGPLAWDVGNLTVFWMFCLFQIHSANGWNLGEHDAHMTCPTAVENSPRPMTFCRRSLCKPTVSSTRAATTNWIGEKCSWASAAWGRAWAEMNPVRGWRFVKNWHVTSCH